MDNSMNLLDIPLTDNEIEELSSFLESLPDAMSIEKVDGLFAALVCSPDLLMPSNYFSHVFGKNNDFGSIEGAEKFISPKSCVGGTVRAASGQIQRPVPRKAGGSSRNLMEVRIKVA